MQKKQYTQQFIRQRRFLTILPVLVLPFLTFLFWSLGGGKSSPAIARDTQHGFNTQLPGAHLKDGKPQDKLSYYEQASADSLKLQQQIKNDPYYRPIPSSDTIVTVHADTMRAASADSMSPFNKTLKEQEYSDANEAKVYRKLAQLNKAINAPSASGPERDETAIPSPNSDVDRLERMMISMQQDNGPDPEMQELNVMLGRILDIQHPELVKERIRQQSVAHRGTVLPVSTGQNSTVSILGNHTSVGEQQDTNLSLPARQNGFYSIGDEHSSDGQTAIEAAIHETQTLVSGSTVKLRLVSDVYINGTLIPRSSFVFGVAQLNGERLAIRIASIRYRNALFPVELSVYDMDGLNGLYIPGAITRDVAKASADRSLQEVGFTPVDPSIGAQAASAGIQAAKTLFSKKVKLIKVTVKAGYKVLLVDEKQKRN